MSRSKPPKPFSGKRYNDNAERDDTSKHVGPCAVCGKPVKKGVPHRWAEVVDGGERFVPYGSGDENDAGHMGVFPVGSECAKLFPAGVLSPLDTQAEGGSR